jgi:hypothetical protein
VRLKMAVSTPRPRASVATTTVEITGRAATDRSDLEMFNMGCLIRAWPSVGAKALTPPTQQSKTQKIAKAIVGFRAHSLS